MENSYELLRKNYRDVIQTILDHIDNLTENESRNEYCNMKKHISNIYRSKNVKKSIDVDLKNYILELNTENKKISFHDSYWSDYNFTRSVLEIENIEKVLGEMYQSALKYFCLLEVPEENSYENKKSNIFDGDFFSIIDSIIKNLPEQNFEKDSCQNTENQEECFNKSPFPFPEEIVKLAQELSSEINIPDSFYDENNDSEFGKNPKKIFEKLTTSEGQSVLMNMMEKVSSKLNQKISSGEIDPTQMQNSAQECLEKIMKNSDFENVLKNFSPENMQNIFNTNNVNVNNLEKTNETKKRLQKKLKKKHIING